MPLGRLHSMKRGYIFKFAACFTLGLVFSLALAVVAALVPFHYSDVRPVIPKTGMDWGVIRGDRWCSTFCYFIRRAEDDSSSFSPVTMVRAICEPYVSHSVVPIEPATVTLSMDSLEQAAPPWMLSKPVRHQAWGYGFGWPLRCLNYIWTVEPFNPNVSDYELLGGIQIAKAQEARYRDFTKNYSDAIPISVIWTGLLANTLCFGFAFFILSLGPGTLRRYLRNKRGHCPNCNYDLLADFNFGCPECGWNRPTSSPPPANTNP